MTVSENLPIDVCIEGIVASPAVSGAGRALIEIAVRWSERCGCSGKVSLWAHDKAVSEIYICYGFESLAFGRQPVSGGALRLNPFTSDAWEKTRDGWSLKAKIGKAYAVSGVVPEAIT